MGGFCAGQGLGGMKYLWPGLSSRSRPGSRASDDEERDMAWIASVTTIGGQCQQAEPSDAGSSTSIDPDWPTSVNRNCRTKTRQPRPIMSDYEFHHRFADLADVVCPYRGSHQDGCCDTSDCWCRRPVSIGGALVSDEDEMDTERWD
jgi:hypothetical protein